MECFGLLKEVFGENAMYVCMFLNGTRYFLNVGIRLKMMKVPVDLWWQELKEIFRKLMKMCCETEVLAFGWSPTSWTLTKNGLEKSHSGTKRQPQEHLLCRHETAYRGTKLVHKYHLIWWDMDYPVWTGNKALIGRISKSKKNAMLIFFYDQGCYHDWIPEAQTGYLKYYREDLFKLMEVVRTKRPDLW